MGISSMGTRALRSAAYPRVVMVSGSRERSVTTGTTTIRMRASRTAKRPSAGMDSSRRTRSATAAPKIQMLDHVRHPARMPCAGTDSFTSVSKDATMAMTSTKMPARRLVSLRLAEMAFVNKRRSATMETTTTQMVVRHRAFALVVATASSSQETTRNATMVRRTRTRKGAPPPASSTFAATATDEPESRNATTGTWSRTMGVPRPAPSRTRATRSVRPQGQVFVA